MKKDCLLSGVAFPPHFSALEIDPHALEGQDTRDAKCGRKGEGGGKERCTMISTYG